MNNKILARDDFLDMPFDEAVKLRKKTIKKCKCGHTIRFKNGVDKVRCECCGRLHTSPKYDFREELKKKVKEIKE